MKRKCKVCHVIVKFVVLSVIAPTSLAELFYAQHILHPLTDWIFYQVKGIGFKKWSLCILLRMYAVTLCLTVT